MQCKEVEVVLEREGLSPLPEAAREHLAGCGACQSLVADLTSIVDAAHALPAELDPPERVWISLRSQLASEGLIKTPVGVVERASWWHGLAEIFGSRALATATVGLLIVGAAALQLRQPLEPAAEPRDPLAETAMALNQAERDLPNMQLVSNSTVDTSLRQNLQTVDEFIADCERHVKEVPQDDLTREYLSSAYQQKAELLSEMMERGRSGN